MRQLLLFFGLTFFSSALMGQDLQDRMLEAPAMHADLDSLDVLLHTIHQDMFYFASPTAWENTLTWAYQQCERPQSYPEFAAIVATLLRTLQDSHTYLDFGHLAREIRASNSNRLGLVWARDKQGIYIKSSSNDSLPAGTYVAAWNGHVIEDLYKQVARYGIQEGASIAASAQVNMVLFGSLLPLVAPVREVNRVTYGLGTDTAHTYHMSYASKKKRFSWLKRETSHLGLEVLPEHDLAVLTVKSFSKGTGRYYYRFLRKSFRTLEKEGVGNLAIDIRHNTGGSSARRSDLLKYVLQDSISEPHQMAYLQSEQSKRLLLSKYGWFSRLADGIFNRNNLYVNNFKSMLETPVGQSDTLIYDRYKPFEKVNFAGPCFLLMDGLSGSASVSMAGVFAREQRGELVGTPCLGPMSGTWGNPMSLSLPETGLRIIVSTMRSDYSGSFDKNPTAVQPTIPVDITAADRANGTDPVLLKVKELIQAQASSPN